MAAIEAMAGMEFTKGEPESMTHSAITSFSQKLAPQSSHKIHSKKILASYSFIIFPVTSIQSGRI
jgi:hypothetical protein